MPNLNRRKTDRMNPQLKMMLVVDQDAAGALMVAAINLGAKLEGLGVIKALPYNKNMPRLTHEPGERRGRPPSSPSPSPQGAVRRQLNPRSDKEGRRSHYRRALKPPVSEETSPSKDVRSMYAAIRGVANGMGNALKGITVRKDDRVYLKKG